MSASCIRASPPPPSGKGAGWRSGFTFSIVVVTPDGRDAGQQESWVPHTLGVPKVSFSFSGSWGCPQGYLRAGKQDINALLDSGVLWDQPDMETRMLAREVTVHRKRGCVAERGSPTDSVLLDNHRLRDCCREAEREKKGMRTVLSGMARESRDLVQGEPH